MLYLSNAGKRFSKAGLFQQIALFSATGLTMSLAFVFVGGVRIPYFWF